MFSVLPFSDTKFELAISVLQPLNFHLAMPNYALVALCICRVFVMFLLRHLALHHITACRCA